MFKRLSFNDWPFSLKFGVAPAFAVLALIGIALMGGFAEVEADDVTVLVNSAELGSSIDGSSAESELQAARSAVSKLEGQPTSPEKVKAQQSLNRARARAQAAINQS